MPFLKRNLKLMRLGGASVVLIFLCALTAHYAFSELSLSEFNSLYQKFLSSPLPLSIQPTHKKPLSNNALVQFWTQASARAEKIIGTIPEALTVQIPELAGQPARAVTVHVDRGLTLWAIAKRAEFTYEVLANRNPFYDSQASIKQVESKIVEEDGDKRTPKVNLPLYMFATAQLEQAVSETRYKVQSQLDSYKSQIENFQQYVRLTDGQFARIVRENQMAEALASKLPIPLPGGIPTPSQAVDSTVAAYEPLFKQAFQEGPADASSLLRARNASGLAGLVLRDVKQLSQSELSNAELVLNTVTTVSKNMQSAMMGYRTTLHDNWSVLGYASADDAARQEKQEIGDVLAMADRLKELEGQLQRTKKLMAVNLVQTAKWETKLAARTEQLDAKIQTISAGQNWTQIWDKALVEELAQNGSLIALLPETTTALQGRVEGILGRLASASPDERVDLQWALKSIDKNLAFNSWFVAQTLQKENNLSATVAQAGPGFQSNLYARTGQADIKTALAQLRGGVDLGAQASAIDGLRRLIGGAL